MQKAAGILAQAAALLIASSTGDGDGGAGAPGEAADGGSIDGGAWASCGLYPLPPGHVCCDSYYMASVREVVLGSSCAIDAACDGAPSQATCTACHVVSFAPRPQQGVRPHYGGPQHDDSCRGCHPRPWPKSLR